MIALDDQQQTNPQHPPREPRRRLHSSEDEMRKILPVLLFLAIVSHLLAAKEALLIANADYSHFGSLPNPISDARQLADVLRQLGFNVNVVENASKEAMLDALGSFEERLKASRGIAFFHYGGHGVQLNGKNFLIPADAEIPAENRLATRAVDFDEIMGALETSGSEANVVVLDACRDNPLPATASRSATRGLSVVVRPPKNSIIIYAAEAGSKAQDGLFTPTLSQALAASGNRDISEVMKQVRRAVYEQSGGSQTPGEYNQLFSELALGSSATSVSIEPSAPVVKASQLPPIPDQQGVPDQVVSAEQVIRAFFGSLEQRNELQAAALLAPKVDYYQFGEVDRSKALADIRGDWARWSFCDYTVSDFRILTERNGVAECAFTLDYSVSDQKRPRSGRLDVRAMVTIEGAPSIRRIKSDVISAR